MMSLMPRAAADESVFHAIASPMRRALIDALTDGERNVSELVASVDVTQSAVSQQLKILKSAGFVDERAEGRHRVYRLRTEPLAELDAWLALYHAYAEHQLDALGRVLDAMPDEPPPRRRRKR